MKICIDPGHGGNDSGAVGPSGLTESSVVLTISRKVSEKLAALANVETLMTRSSNVFVELGKRCEIANEWGADYFVSIHLNSDGPTAVGIETLYTSTSGKALATPIQEAMVAATGDTDRGLKERDDLYVLNGTNMPAALAEAGFISHPTTESKLKTKEYQELLASAIVSGITKVSYAYR
jgi:N-acetylmuramoyl-L-alanine amidase